MDYRHVDMWKKRGFINDNMTPDEKVSLTKNLILGSELLNSRCFLYNYEQCFRADIEQVLYPIIVHYTIIKKSLNINGKSIIHEFLRFCEENIRIKYFFDKYDDDYLLCQEFINKNI